jgi:lysophospholipase L1-like esterase
MRPKALLRRLGLVLAGGVVFFALGETAARLAEPGSFSLLDRTPFLPDEELVWRHRPGFRGRWEDTWYEIDSRGLRGPELPDPAEPGRFRVVALGDSCTAGKGVLERESWPRVLEGLLAEELPPGLAPMVANLGVVGWAGREYVASLRRFGLELRPHLVVVGYNLNDFPNPAAEVDQRVFHERGLRLLVPTWLRDALSRTALYRFARATYYELSRSDDWERVAEIAAATTASDPEVLRRERALLEALSLDAASVGARLLVLLFPYESQVYVEAYDPAPIEGFAALCQELDIPFLDLAQVFRAAAAEGSRGLFLRGDRYHPSARGYRLVAEAVLERLLTLGWLPES